MYNISANTIFTGKSLIYLPTCHSTNEVAYELINSKEPAEGTIIITSSQTAGKGQRGNSWEAEPGLNLTFSLILRPRFLKVKDQFYLNIITSLAVRHTVAKFLEDTVKVKWPNDIYLNDRKICGILVQNSVQKDSLGYSIAGIGLNVNQESFSDKKAISMKNHRNISFDHNLVLNDLMENLEALYLRLRAGEYDALKEEYISHLYRFGKTHSFRSREQVFPGEITGIDETGRLLIRLHQEIRAFDFKEVEFI